MLRKICETEKYSEIVDQLASEMHMRIILPIKSKFKRNSKAYYIAFRDTGEFTDSFYAQLIEKFDLTKNISADIPAGCSAHIRTNGTAEYIFIENYNNYEVNIVLHDVYTDIDTNEEIRGNIILQPYSVNILKK